MSWTSRLLLLLAAGLGHKQKGTRNDLPSPGPERSIGNYLCAVCPALLLCPWWRLYVQSAPTFTSWCPPQQVLQCVPLLTHTFGSDTTACCIEVHVVHMYMHASKYIRHSTPTGGNHSLWQCIFYSAGPLGWSCCLFATQANFGRKAIL